LFENKITAAEAATSYHRMWNVINMEVGEEIDDS